ncbi:fungal hydrophobin [Suillus ampliporus]|nr:fungal hydrophobin [Suillus ampliporus]
MIANILALLPFALFAVAQTQCDTGSIQCCQSAMTFAAAEQAFPAFDLAAIDAWADALVGLTCSPLSVVGTGSGCAANQEPLCCEGNSYNGLVNLGCSPINIGA